MNRFLHCRARAASSLIVLLLLAKPVSAWARDPEPVVPPNRPDSTAPASSDADQEPPAPAAAAPPTANASPSTPPSSTPSDGQVRTTFHVEPVLDVAVIAVSAGFAGLLDLVIGTGELRAQQISSTFETKQLLSIDRGAVSQHVDPNAATFSNIGLGVALGYAVIDPIATGFREKSVQSALIDAVLYAETLTITLAVTNLAKVAVRRPRPLAYAAAQEHKDDPTYSNGDTDSSLSFFSGHTSTAAALTATASYLAFARAPKSARPWITLAVGTALTSFVGFERVRAGKHFPTDVIAGALAGAGVGILVPHLHRTDTTTRPTWVGATPLGNDGGMISFNGLF
jgi:membrane-associated phospholipid phosphatase